MYVYLNNPCKDGDNITVTASSYHTDENDARTLNSYDTHKVEAGSNKLEFTIRAKSGDVIEVSVAGTQQLAKGVYFYEPEGGREVSQCFVGVGSGKTNVGTSKEFIFEENSGDMGIRIYKTGLSTGYPIEGIVFDIYSTDKTTLESAEATEDEIAQYAVEANKITNITTDSTGYASTPVEEEGIYLIVEQENAKVEEPADPFYVVIPMTEKTVADGEEVINVHNVVSVYPKNTPVPPPDDPPPPPPDELYGKFAILKYDADDRTKVLEGAEFRLYRAATDADTDTELIEYNGGSYNVVDTDIILTTGADGRVESPSLPCGVYFLKEIKAPSGYHLTTQVYKFNVIADIYSEQTIVEVPNETGVLLPETGGTGTVMFTVAGTAMMLLAGIFLFVRRRMKMQ